MQKLFSDIAPKFSRPQGGYTRIIKLAEHRIGDGGDLVLLQLLTEEVGPQGNGPPQAPAFAASATSAGISSRREFSRRAKAKTSAAKPNQPSKPAEEVAKARGLIRDKPAVSMPALCRIAAA